MFSRKLVCVDKISGAYILLPYWIKLWRTKVPKIWHSAENLALCQILSPPKYFVCRNFVQDFHQYDSCFYGAFINYELFEERLSGRFLYSKGFSRCQVREGGKFT